MIASDRDGAITRTDEPRRSFGGTTGTGPSCPVPAGAGNHGTGIVTCRRAARPRRRSRPARATTTPASTATAATPATAHTHGGGPGPATELDHIA
jgi:hypothetical protein